MSIEVKRRFCGITLPLKTLNSGDSLLIRDKIINPEPPVISINGETGDPYLKYNHMVNVVTEENREVGLKIDLDPEFIKLCRRISGVNVSFPPIFGENINYYLGGISFRRRGRPGMRIVFQYVPDKK